MRTPFKRLPALAVAAAVACAAGAWLLQCGAPDWWGYGKLGVSDGRPESPVYFLEVRGVGDTPAVARVVRFPDHAAAPRNQLAVSHAVSGEFASRVRNADRWAAACVVIAGRTNDEKVEIPLDASAARALLARPGDRYLDVRAMDAFWGEHVAAHLPGGD